MILFNGCDLLVFQVISLYPGKEVKKGLEQLYKKIEKHLADDSPLLQVVWRNMQVNVQ